MAVDLRQEVDALAALARNKPNAAGRERVAQALVSKFEGLQAAAAKTLGAWGDAESIAALRELLVRAEGRPFGWSVRHVAIAALRPRVAPSDADWVLDLYFGAGDLNVSHEHLPLLEALPIAVLRSRVNAELKSSEPSRRQAATTAAARLKLLDS